MDDTGGGLQPGAASGRTKSSTRSARVEWAWSIAPATPVSAALKEGVSYCNSVYGSMTDQKGLETVPFYFGATPRLSVLYFVVTHTYEHYGNLVT